MLFSFFFSDLTRWGHNNFGSLKEWNILIKRKFLCHFIFGVKIVQKGASEIQTKCNFNNFQSNYSIANGLKSFKQLDHFSTSRQSLQHHKKIKKTQLGLQWTSEGLHRTTSLTMSICASRDMVAPGHVLWTAVEWCKCSISFRYVIFQDC